VFIASLFGALSPYRLIALSPFCSCGVIPIIASLLGAGVPLASVMSFWIASPVMDPEMFILTAAGISFEFALAKTGFAIAFGIFPGLTVILALKLGWMSNNILRQSVYSSCASSGGPEERQRIQFAFWKNKASV
jgi:uncharacterized membrane protein YraQ (UPF0718 family)